MLNLIERIDYIIAHIRYYKEKPVYEFLDNIKELLDLFKQTFYWKYFALDRLEVLM